MKPQKQKIKPQKRAWLIPAFAMLFLSSLMVFLFLWHLPSVTVQGQARSSLQVRSSDFSDGGAIPRRFTCDGADVSPNLQWTAAPAGAKSFAIVMDDPDASADFTHWLAYNIPPDISELAEGASAQAMPHGSAQGMNDFQTLGYGGPCPPPGKPHHYVFRLYALDIRLNLPPRAARKEVESAIEGHIVGEGRIVGIYQSAKK
jgi:Raf kinase inhibitor-like YbhB/YbcL family protein